jgi:hypothetical protein
MSRLERVTQAIRVVYFDPKRCSVDAMARAAIDAMCDPLDADLGPDGFPDLPSPVGYERKS